MNFFKVFLLMIVPFYAFSQSDWSISVYNNSVSFPHKPINGAMHPGIETSYSYQMNGGSKNQFYLGLSVGFFFVKDLMKSTTIKPVIEYKIKTVKNFSTRMSFSPGLMIEKNQVDEFDWDNESRKYKFKPRRMHYSLFTTLGIQPELKIGNGKELKNFEWSGWIKLIFDKSVNEFDTNSVYLPSN